MDLTNNLHDNRRIQVKVTQWIITTKLIMLTEQ